MEPRVVYFLCFGTSVAIAENVNLKAVQIVRNKISPGDKKMKNKLGIISALVLSLAVAGSALAGVAAPKNNKPHVAAAGAKMNAKKASPRKHRKHRKARHAGMTKSAKTMTPPAKK